MPSIHPDYTYDIFISYRQKDNKGDKWVTEFVKALKTELESTFKEDISIYFDVNPHDSLLEMHQVDRRLEGKLKNLILSETTRNTSRLWTPPLQRSNSTWSKSVRRRKNHSTWKNCLRNWNDSE